MDEVGGMVHRVPWAPLPTLPLEHVSAMLWAHIQHGCCTPATRMHSDTLYRRRQKPLRPFLTPTLWHPWQLLGASSPHRWHTPTPHAHPPWLCLRLGYLWRHAVGYAYTQG